MEYACFTGCTGGYGRRGVATRTLIPHSLGPGTPGEFLPWSQEVPQAGREMLQLEEGLLSVMPPRRMGERAQRPGDPLGGCGDGPRRREPEMTDTGAGQ